MIRIIFDNGDLVECENIDKIYIDKREVDKVVVVGELLDKVYLAEGKKDVQIHDAVTEEKE